MRCRNTRTDNPPRVSFCFIVKSDIEVFVWSVVKVRISISSVGATIGRPRSYRLSLHIRLRSLSIVGVDVLDDPREIPANSKISIEYFFLIVGTGVPTVRGLYGHKINFRQQPQKEISLQSLLLWRACCKQLSSLLRKHRGDRLRWMRLTRQKLFVYKNLIRLVPRHLLHRRRLYVSLFLDFGYLRFY